MRTSVNVLTIFLLGNLKKVIDKFAKKTIKKAILKKVLKLIKKNYSVL